MSGRATTDWPALVSKYIHHVMLTTGHSRRSYRHEIQDDTVIAELSAILDVALTAGDAGAPIVRCPGYWLVAVDGPTLLATVLADKLPIATIGVAGHSRSGAQLWRKLHESAHAAVPVVTDPAKCPPEPWVAARPEVGVCDHADANAWLEFLRDHCTSPETAASGFSEARDTTEDVVRAFCEAPETDLYYFLVCAHSLEVRYGQDHVVRAR